MIVNMSGTGRRPELVTMEGETGLSLLGIDIPDQIIMQKGYITRPEAIYLQRKYGPELMGILPLILAALPAVAAGAASIITAVKGGKKESPQNVEASNTAALQAQLQLQQAQQQAAQTAAANQANTMKTVAMIGIPAAAFLFMMFMMNRPQRR